MKRFSILTAMLLLALIGCNKESRIESVSPDDADKVYMTFRVSTLDTRSSTNSGEDDPYGTSDAGVELGQDSENNVASVNIILKDGDKAYEAVKVIPTNTGNANVKAWVASFVAPELLSEEDKKVSVYIYINGESKTDLNFIHTISSDNLEAEGGIAESNNFYMTNADDDNTHILNVAKLKAATSENNPYDLGDYFVERAAARFDYKAVKTDNTYPVGVTQVPDDSEGAAEGAMKDVTTVNVQLQDIALVNMSDSFYALRRTVSEANLDTFADNWMIGGTETNNNYVVGAGKAWSNAASMLYPLDTDNEDTYAWSSLSDISNNSKDNYGDKEYNIWRYATENTIPGKTQKKDVTTAVVFRGQMTATDYASEELQKAFSNCNETIYVFENEMLGTWSMVENHAKANPDLLALNAAVAAVKAVTDESKVNEAKADYGFTGYSPKTVNNIKGYYATYYYWNRHNDNNEPGVMGPMEFAVVRNNVYKLSVTEINRFGHPYNPDPENPDPDPDPEDPDDPDEELKYYFRVAVKVLPWVVRLNAIEF